MMSRNDDGIEQLRRMADARYKRRRPSRWLGRLLIVIASWSVLILIAWLLWQVLSPLLRMM